MTASGPERRRNLLTGDWVLVSPQRAGRPWAGAVEPPAASDAGARRDGACPLCPGARRAGGARNPDYEGVFVFANDFPALVPEVPSTAGADDLLLRAPESGLCRVICYSPDHCASLATMSPAEIGTLVDVWAEQSAELLARPDIGAVTLFENRGEMMGASCPHPHAQAWATASVPNELAREARRQTAWMAARGSPLLADYLARELAEEERMVVANEAFAALVPFWAAWPFETLILPRRPIADLAALDKRERDGLAGLLSRLMSGYDRLFAAPFPYSFGFHQRPAVGQSWESFVLHAHVYPPLLRSASVRKFMVGFELLAMPQRDLTPEAAAARLRAVM